MGTSSSTPEDDQDATKAEEEQKAKEAAEATKRAEEEQKAREVAEAAKKTEEDQKAREAADAAKKAEEEQKAKEAAEAAEKAEAERAREAADAAKKKEEEQKAKEAAEAAKEAEEQKAKEAAEAAKRAEEEKAESAAEASGKAEEDQKAGVKATAPAVVDAAPPGLEAEEPGASTESPLEEAVRRAAHMLRKLPPSQRPATAERLRSLLRVRCCGACLSRVAGCRPAALVAALHQQLDEHPTLQVALKPFISPTPVGADEASSARVASKIVLPGLIKMRDLFTSNPLVWRAEKLYFWCKIVAGKRTKSADLLAELRARGLVADSEGEGKAGSPRLAYDEAKLEAVPRPRSAVSESPAGADFKEGSLQALEEAAKDAIFMPVLAGDVSTPFGKGVVGKAFLDLLAGGGPKTPPDVMKRLNSRAQTWVQEAAEEALGEHPCSKWGKAVLRGSEVVVSYKISPKPDRERFHEALRRKITGSFPAFDLVVRDLVLDGAFYGRKGSHLRQLEEALQCGLLADRRAGVVKICRFPHTAISQKDLHAIIELLASSRPPIKHSVDKSRMKHIIGKGGKGILQVQLGTQTRLKVNADCSRLEGWPAIEALAGRGQDQSVLDFLKAKVKAAPEALKASCDAIWGRALNAQHNAQEMNFGAGAAGAAPPRGTLKLERTFSSEYKAMKLERDAKREITRAKKAQAASRRQGGGHGRQSGSEVPRSAVAEVVHLRREVVAGFRALGELIGVDSVTQEDLEDQRGQLEDSMRGCLEAAAEALQISGNALKAEALASSFEKLLDPEHLRDVSTRDLALGNMVAKITGADVWQRLDQLSRPRPAQNQQKEVLVHVRKGKPTRKAEERGGRYKPGEASSASGQNVEEGLEAVPEPPAEEPEPAADGDDPQREDGKEAAAREESTAVDP